LYFFISAEALRAAEARENAEKMSKYQDENLIHRIIAAAIEVQRLGRDFAILGEAFINLSAFSLASAARSASALMKIHAEFLTKQRFISRPKMSDAECLLRSILKKVF
jgi:hypothetical protein